MKGDHNQEVKRPSGCQAEDQAEEPQSRHSPCKTTSKNPFSGMQALLTTIRHSIDPPRNPVEDHEALWHAIQVYPTLLYDCTVLLRHSSRRSLIRYM